jgi:parvulin-like peptidyl-prolyl isomerase
MRRSMIQVGEQVWKRARKGVRPVSIAVLGVVLGVTLGLVTGAAAADPKLPVIQGKKVVASVNDEPITLDEFNYALASLQRTAPPGKGVSKEDEAELLERLINARLIIQEAQKIGLDELPEIKNMVDVFARVTLREQLMERMIKNVKADEKEVDKLYKEAVKEWKVSSVVFEKEDDARKMVEELKAGKRFDELSKALIAAGKAKGDEARYVKVKELNPQVVLVVSKMTPGSVSPIIPLQSGFAVVRLEDVRYPDNAEEKERARAEALKQKRLNVLKGYNNSLIKKYAKVHKDVLDRLDFEAKEPGFQILVKDTRPLADIKGEKPITVGDLSQALRQQLYHGVDQAIESKKVNARKMQMFEDILYKRVFRKEALRLGLDKTESYTYKVKEYEDSVIFGAFIQKAVVPDVKVSDEEMRTYYQEHIGEYTLPELMRVDGLAFDKRADAESAIEKLRKGADFSWLSANAEGQADKSSKGLLRFEGKLLTTKDLPEGVQKAVSGARSGDSRLYAASEGYFYVLFMREVIPSSPKPFEEARQEIGQKVFDEKVRKAMNDWTAKLRAASDIKIYLKDS